MGSFGLPGCPIGLDGQGTYDYEDTPGPNPAIELLDPLGEVSLAFMPWQHYDMYCSALPLEMAQGHETAASYGSNPSEHRSWDDGTAGTSMVSCFAALQCPCCQTTWIHAGEGPARANLKKIAGSIYFGADEGPDPVQGSSTNVTGAAPAVAGGQAVHHSIAHAFSQTHLQSPDGREVSEPSLGLSMLSGRDRQPGMDGHLGQARGRTARPSGGGLGVEAKTRGATRGGSGEARVKQRGVLCKYRDPTKTRKGPRYSCVLPGCAETFTTRKDLERHQTQSLTHPETFEAQYRCDDSRCGSWGRIFTRKDNFDRHVKTLHAELR